MYLDRLAAKEIIRALADNIVDLDEEVRDKLREAATSKLDSVVKIPIDPATNARIEPRPINVASDQLAPPFLSATQVDTAEAHLLELTPELEKIGWTQETIDVHNDTVRRTFDNQEKLKLRKSNYNAKDAVNAEFAPPDVPPEYGLQVVAVGAQNRAGDTCIKQEATENPRQPVISVYQCKRGHVYPGNNPAMNGCPTCAFEGEGTVAETTDDDDTDDDRW